MLIEFPGHGMLVNVDSIDHVRIETVRGAKSNDRLLHKLVLYLTQNHVDSQNGDRRKFVVMKSENREEICAVWRVLIDSLNDVVIQIETPTF